MITFTPLSGGATGTGEGEGLAYLLVVDDVRVLLDCGRSSIQAASDTYIDALRETANSIDLVLLTHGDAAHTGLYAYARAHWNLLAPTYATLPVQAFAKLDALERSQVIRAEQDIALEAQHNLYTCTPEQISTAFDSVVPLRYTQPTHLQGKCTGLTITPYNSGHSLGGTIWKIRSPSSGTILYCVGMNHTKERMLDGTVLVKSSTGGGAGLQIFEPLARPDVLITDASRTLTLTPRRKDRESHLLDLITSTLTVTHASILMPTSLGSRLLELLVLLDQHWEFARIKAPLCLVARNGNEMLTLAKSLMEFFGGAIGAGILTSGGVGAAINPSNSNNRRRDNLNTEDSPLRLKNIEFFPSPASLLSTYSSRDPKLILATPLDMSYGSSRTVLVEHGLGAGDGNIILLTDRRGGSGLFSDGTVTPYETWLMGQDEEEGKGKPRIGRIVKMGGKASIKMCTKQPLAGDELEQYLQAEKAKAAASVQLERDRRMLEADVDSDSSSSGDSNDDSDDENDLQEEMEVDQLVEVAAEPGGQLSRNKRKSRKDDPYAYDYKLDMMDQDEMGDAGRQQNYDTYVKHSTMRSKSFFGGSRSVMGVNGKETGGSMIGSTGVTKHKMFPFLERRRRVDAYGEIVDVGMWLRRGKEIEEGVAHEHGVEGAERDESPENGKSAEEQEPPEPPSKYVSSSADVELRCEIMYVDMEGLNDGRAVKTILPQVNPRKMILVHATNKCTEALMQSFSQIKSMTKDVFASSTGETTQIGQHTKSFAISLSDELVAGLKMSSFEDNEVGFVRGRIATHASSSIPILEPLLPAVSTSPKTVSGALPQSTLIGDLKLTLLKSRLSDLGISAEFAGEGVLLCSAGDGDGLLGGGEVVSVKKQGSDKVYVEACGPGDVYYVVRREVYGLHAVVGA